MEKTNDIKTNNLIEETNCLALTLSKDYKLVALKNVCTKALMTFNKITISIGTISFINFFL